MLADLEVENNDYHVLKLEPLYVWHHWEMVLVMGSAVFLPVPVIPIMMLFICIVKLWILFFSVVETLVFFPVENQLEYLQHLVY